MPDYGHDLQFGAFLTPGSRDPHAVVELARTSERAGLDLVTFQDHPYQPAFLDTWTLLSWVAARTDRIHLAGNVLNVPLRPPAVLARAAASLDLLSGGRVDLGLGAGAFWDAMEAMGVARLTPGEGVDALAEAIDVIRGIWAVGDRTPLRAGGRHHHVDGAKRGPAPAHEIPIWLGAYKPRMLRLTGERADGWLPSLGYLQPQDAAAANRVIDEAATGAGREPREVRRLLNLPGATFGDRSAGFLQGPPAQWVDQLLPLALEDGFSTFVLGSDDAAVLERFAAEVAPALREAVAAERAAAGTTTGRVRSPRALAARDPRVDYETVPDRLRALAVEPGDAGYARVRSTYVWVGSPALVLRCRDADDVSAALTWARSQPVPLAVRSGGHGISGRATNDGGIVVDVGPIDGVEVLDADRGLVRIGTGARWGDVAAALSPAGLAISAGDSGEVGVGGLVTAGGLGLMSRRHGLTIDHLVGAEVVLADGSVVRADAVSHPDLFWALRGAGANMGVVTSVEIEASRVGDVVLCVVVYDASDAGDLLAGWGPLVEAAPRELTGFLTLVPPRGANPAIGQAMLVWAGDDTTAAVEVLEPFLALAPVLQQQAQLAPYAAVVPAHHAEHHGGGMGTTRSGLLEHLTPDAARLLGAALAAGVVDFMQLRAVGGAVNDVDPAATAYAHRTQAFSLLAIHGDAATGAVEDLWSALRPNLHGLYLSFETGAGPDLLAEAFPGATLDRLRTIKATYDPAGVFDQNFPIPPATV